MAAHLMRAAFFFLRYAGGEARCFTMIAPRITGGCHRAVQSRRSRPTRLALRLRAVAPAHPTASCAPASPPPSRSTRARGAAPTAGSHRRKPRICCGCARPIARPMRQADAPGRCTRCPRSAVTRCDRLGSPAAASKAPCAPASPPPSRCTPAGGAGPECVRRGSSDASWHLS
jgi:hypothetical protein